MIRMPSRLALSLLLTALGVAPFGLAEAAHPKAGEVSHHPLPEKARPGKTTLKGPVEVELKTAFNRPTVQVMIAGKGPYTFLVDTGAGSTVLNSDLVKELGLEVVGKTTLGDPMNPQAIKADIVAIPSIEIGGAKFEDFQAASWDQQDLLKSMSERPRGVIGFPMFAGVLLTFDYVDGKMRLARGELPKADGKTILPYEAPMGIPQFTLKVGDVDVVTHLDTGSGGFLSVPKRYREQLKFAGPLEEVGRARTVNSEMILRGADLVGSVAIGQFAFEKPFVTVSDELPMGNLGSAALAPFAITFDQRAKTMRFEQKAPLVSVRPHRGSHAPGGPVPANANAAATPPPTGLRFATHGAGDLEVHSVEPGSPGAEAGLEAGDKVVEINGVAMAAVPDDVRRAAMRTSPLKLKVERAGAAREVVVVFP